MNNVKEKIKKILAITGLVVILFLLTMMLVETFRGNGQRAFSYLVGIIFVSILIYIMLHFMKKND